VIITRWQGRLLVVFQPDHGTQTGLIAEQWGNDEVPALTDFRGAAEMAASHHDDGWAIWERHPTLEPTTGQPVQFHAVDPVEHIAAYRAGISRAAQLDPWTGLLVSMHGAGLYNDRYGTYRLAELSEQTLSPSEQAVVGEFLSDMAALQQDLAQNSLGHAVPGVASDDPLVRHHYLLLQVWDRLSLQFAFRHAADGVISPLPWPAGTPTQLRCTRLGPMALRLDPYPFAGHGGVFPVRGYLVEDRSYRNPEDFLATLTAAATLDLDCRISR
jgi:hypothetical protein